MQCQTGRAQVDHHFISSQSGRQGNSFDVATISFHYCLPSTAPRECSNPFLTIHRCQLPIGPPELLSFLPFQYALQNCIPNTRRSYILSFRFVTWLEDHLALQSHNKTTVRYTANHEFKVLDIQQFYCLPCAYFFLIVVFLSDEIY